MEFKVTMEDTRPQSTSSCCNILQLPELPELPTELVERIIHFSICVRTFKRVLRLRLVSRQFRNLVEDYMFRTRLLDENLRHIHTELRFHLYSPYRLAGQDSGWLAFLKRYLAYRIYYQPNLDPQCPEFLIHRAAVCLGKMLNDNSESAMLRYVTALCQVGFWEHCCCLNRFSPYTYYCRRPDFMDDTCNYIDSSSNTFACYDGDEPLKRILLDAAIYLNNADLAKKVYSMESTKGYNFDPEKDATFTDDTLTGAHTIGRDRLELAVVHGGLEMFQLVNRIEYGIDTLDKYRKLYHEDALMDYILRSSENGCSDTMIHFLLDIGDPWDVCKIPSWSYHVFPQAMMFAPLPGIFERLAALAGPDISALNQRSVRLCCRSDGMIARLNYSAAANNMVMLQYLLDQGGAPYLNNIHTHNKHRLPYHEADPSKRRTGFWRQWLLNPLVRAVEVGNINMVELMLAHGADPNHNTTGTPLMAAVRRNNPEIARLLIKHGANVDLGLPPPVVLSIKGENSDMFELLRVNGAVLNTPDTGGRAMALVKAEGLETMQDLLVSHGVDLDTTWHHVQSEEEFVLWAQYSEIDAVYGDR